MMEKIPSPPVKSIKLHWILLCIAFALVIIWVWLTPAGILGKADAIGYAVCHRIAERSFHIGTRPVAMCARCSGLFLGALLGLVFQGLQGRKGKIPPIPVLILLGFFAFGWAFDGVNSFLMLMPRLPAFYTTQNWTRLVTGTGMGLAISAILLPSFIQTVFTNWQDAPSLGNWKQVFGLVIGAALLDGVVLLEIHWMMVILSILSALSVLLMLTMIYSMVLVMLFKKENSYENVCQMTPPILGGFIIGLLQIGAIDLVRYILTGTWEGFRFL